MWDLPGPGFEPVSPALAGGFLTTAPPGKPLLLFVCTKKNFGHVVIGGNMENLRDAFEQAQGLSITESRVKRMKNDFNFCISKMTGVE